MQQPPSAARNNHKLPNVSSPGYIADPTSIRDSGRQNEIPLTETGDAYDATPTSWKSLETAPNSNALRAPSTTHYPAETSKALTPVNAQAGQYVANLDRFLQDSITVPGQERRSADTAKYLSQFIGDDRRKNLQQSGYDTKGLFRNATNLTLPVTLGSNKRFSGSRTRTLGDDNLFREHSPELRKFISTGNIPVNINKNTSEIGSHFMPGENPQVNLYRDDKFPEYATNEGKLYAKYYNDYPVNSTFGQGLPADKQTLQHELIHANHNGQAFPEVVTTDGRKSALAGAFGIAPDSGENYTHNSEYEFLRSLRTAKEAYARHLLNTTDMPGELVAKTVQDPNKFREFLGQVYGGTTQYNPDSMRIPSSAAQDRNEMEVYRAFKGLKPAYHRMLDGISKDYPTTSPKDLLPTPLAPDPREIYDKKTINSIFDTVWPQVNNTTSQGRGIDKMAALSPEKEAIIRQVLSAYKKKHGIDMSDVKFIEDPTPRFNNGKKVPKELNIVPGGSWTKNKKIYLAPDMQAAMATYGVKEDKTEFLKRIIAHELGHEVWHNHADDVFKKKIAEQIAKKKFTTNYLKATPEDKKDYEAFAEYLADTL